MHGAHPLPLVSPALRQQEQAEAPGAVCKVRQPERAQRCLFILWDPNRQARHDKTAGTYVVKVPRSTPC